MVHIRNDETTPKDEQRTPGSLFKKLDDRFHFNKDIACTIRNHLCSVWYDDFLHPTVSLYNGDVAFCNPPYSHGKVEAFLSKGYTESLKGAVVVFLIPCDISTQWFDWCMLACEWIRIKGRVHFNHADGTPIKGSPSFSSIVVVFDGKRRKENGHLIVSSMEWK